MLADSEIMTTFALAIRQENCSEIAQGFLVKVF